MKAANGDLINVLDFFRATKYVSFAFSFMSVNETSGDIQRLKTAAEGLVNTLKPEETQLKAAMEKSIDARWTATEPSGSASPTT
jgi:hypothetical protein